MVTKVVNDFAIAAAQIQNLCRIIEQRADVGVQCGLVKVQPRWTLTGVIGVVLGELGVGVVIGHCSMITLLTYFFAKLIYGPSFPTIGRMALQVISTSAGARRQKEPGYTRAVQKLTRPALPILKEVQHYR
jgi:hypothetical protein